MTEECTIYCKNVDVDGIGSQLKEYWPKVRFHPEKANSATLKGEKGSLKLTWLIYREGGDQQSMSILAALTRVESSRSKVAKAKRTVYDHIKVCDLTIGVVAEPTFRSDQRYSDVVFFLAAALNGIVFNGTQFMDFGGTVLLEPK